MTTTATPAVQERNTIGGALASTGMTSANGAGFGIAPQTFTELQAYCTLISQSDLVPKDYRGKPGNVMIAVQMGAEIGLQPMQAIQNIAVINGRPSVWGDAALALIQARPDCEDVIESISGSNDDRVATCVVKRRGRTPVTRTFSVKDAGKAHLWGKDGPWQQYPERMLQLRARGFALRDAFPDALKGIAIAEEARDIPAERSSVGTDEASHQATAEQGAPQAQPQSRTSALREKLARSTMKADEPPADAVDAQFSEVAAEPAATTDSKEKARELRAAIAKAWANVPPEIRVAALSRCYAKNALTDLNEAQLVEFLENSPALIEELSS